MRKLEQDLKSMVNIAIYRLDLEGLSDESREYWKGYLRAVKDIAHEFNIQLEGVDLYL